MYSSNTNCLMAKYTAKSSLVPVLMSPLSWLLLPTIIPQAFPLFRALLSETLCCPQLLSYLDLVFVRKPIGSSTVSTILYLIARRGDLSALPDRYPKCKMFQRIILMWVLWSLWLGWPLREYPQSNSNDLLQGLPQSTHPQIDRLSVV